MSLKGFLAKILAKRVKRKIDKKATQAIFEQEKILKYLIKTAQNTQFGKEHNFEQINNYASFKNNVPTRDYEALKPYIEQIKEGTKDVLWPGSPIYFAKTSGTTSGAKYIPISKNSISNHINGARNALLMYIAQTGNSSFLEGKMIFLQGSPILESIQNIKTGRLSGIVAHHVPSYLQKNRMPKWSTNCIEDWDQKVDQITQETLKEDMRLISGIPIWIQGYFEKLIEQSGKKTVSEIFKNFSLFVYGGTSLDGYKNYFKKLIGKNIDLLELFPASEGFFAYQNDQNKNDLLLRAWDGIFYEFKPIQPKNKNTDNRIALKDVKKDIDYAMIISTNAGLWAYEIGDVVRFTSTNPYKIKVVGRVKHFTSAFGEHVIASEVEYAMQKACEALNLDIQEFHVCPVLKSENNLAHHLWIIEFNTAKNKETERLAFELDKLMQAQNPYYKDLRVGKILATVQVKVIKKGTFKQLMKAKGKFGGQNKIQRLSNDRKILDEIIKTTK